MKNSRPPRSIDAQSVQRREFLAGGAAALFAAWLPARIARAETGPLEVQDLMDEALRLGSTYLAGGSPDEPSYLFELASVAHRLGPVEPIELGPPFRGLMETALRQREGQVVLIEWRMEPGTVYPAHNHPNYAGLTLGLEGRCRMRNFQAPDRYPPTGSDRSFRVRETQNGMLEPGRVVSMMTTTHDNIHQLHTGDTAVRGLDVSTLVGEHVGFGFLEIDEASRSEAGEYDAVWEEVYGGYDGS